MWDLGMMWVIEISMCGKRGSFHAKGKRFEQNSNTPFRPFRGFLGFEIMLKG